MGYSTPGSSFHGFLQGRILEWMPFPSPGDLPDLEIEPRSPGSEADPLLSEPPGNPSNFLQIRVVIETCHLAFSQTLGVQTLENPSSGS